MTCPAMTKKEAEVRAAMRDLARALMERDVTLAETLLDADFTGLDASGVLVSKTQWLNDLANGELVFHSIEADDVDVKERDDAVRVRARLTFRAHYSRSNYNGAFDCLGMYVRRGEGWKLLVSKARVRPSGAC